MERINDLFGWDVSFLLFMCIVQERRILNGPWGPAKAALVRNYLEVYWPCAGELSAVNAIGTQLRDPINSD